MNKSLINEVEPTSISCLLLGGAIFVSGVDSRTFESVAAMMVGLLSLLA